MSFFCCNFAVLLHFKMPPDDLHMNYEDAFRALRTERDMWRDKYLALQQEFTDYLKHQVDELQQVQPVLPPEGKYEPLVQWLRFQKAQGNDYYAEAGYNRSKMCRDLRKIIGWEPDQSSLRKAQNK